MFKFNTIGIASADGPEKNPGQHELIAEQNPAKTGRHQNLFLTGRGFFARESR